MTAITKDLLKQLRVDMNAALLAVAQKHGVSISTGNASFNAEQATFKVDILQSGTTSQDAHMDKMASALALAKFYYPNVDAAATYSFRGEKFKIVGYNTRAKGFPFIIECLSNGKNFKAAAADMGTRYQVVPA